MTSKDKVCCPERQIEHYNRVSSKEKVNLIYELDHDLLSTKVSEEITTAQMKWLEEKVL